VRSRQPGVRFSGEQAGDADGSGSGSGDVGDGLSPVIQTGPERPGSAAAADHPAAICRAGHHL